MERKWKSNDAGILDIIGGMIIIALGAIFPFAIWNYGILTMPRTREAVFIAIPLGVALFSLGLFVIYGGEMARKRRRWGLVVVASICASIVFLGIPALILTMVSRKEFGVIVSREKR